MKLFTKGLLLIALPAGFQLLGLLFVFKVQADAADAADKSTLSKQVLTAANRVEIPILTIQADIRRAAIVNDPTMGNDPALWHDVEDRAATLVDLVAHNPPQAEHARKITADIEAFRAWSIDIATQIASGSSGSGMALQRIREGSGKQIVDQFLEDMDSFLTEERTLDRERALAAEAARHQQIIVLITAAAVALAASGLAAYLFTRNVADRIETLTANAGRLADNVALAAPVRGSDEIAELDRVLHQSALRLASADRAEAGFRETLEKRADELAAVNEHLRQQTQDNEMFIYSVSHDLRSPLVNLQGFGKELALVVQDIRVDIEGSALPEQQKKSILTLIDRDMRESLRFLQTAVGRAAGIIDALLRLSRAGRVEYRRQQVDVAAITRRVVDAMSGSIREKGVTITVGELPPALGDTTAIEQVIGNLVANAVNYLDPARPGVIEIGSLPAAQDATLQTYYVKDNGLGIPAAYMDKMFRAFQRLHGDVAKGEGIGLALIRRVVERHGGKVWVESEEGKQTTFFVSLPPWTPEAPASPNPTE